MSFFDHPTSAPPPAPAEPTLDPTSTASVLYGKPSAPPERTDTPPDVLEARQTVERSLFGATTFVNQLPDDVVPGLDAREARQIASDIGADVNDVVAFRRMAEAHVSTPADDETRAAWRAASERFIEGNKITPAELSAARRLVASDPRLKSFLDVTGLGDSPDVVKRILELSKSTKGRR